MKKLIPALVAMMLLFGVGIANAAKNLGEDQAKKDLAALFGVSPENLRITGIQPLPGLGETKVFYQVAEAQVGTFDFISGNPVDVMVWSGKGYAIYRNFTDRYQFSYAATPWGNRARNEKGYQIQVR